MAREFRIRRGLKQDLPHLKDGELGVTTDTNELYVGNTSNILLNGVTQYTDEMAQYAAVENAITSGITLKAPSEDAVYNALALKSDTTHNHDLLYSLITHTHDTVFTNNVFWLDITDYGAVGDGVTDDTSSIQTCINTAISEKKAVFIPAGTFVCNNLNLDDDLEIFGVGAQSILYQTSTYSEWDAILWTNRASGEILEDNNMKNIYIHNLKLKGRVTTGTVYEHLFLMALSAVSNVKIHRVIFEGMVGDGIYMAAADVPGGNQRHNKHIYIRECLFDGLIANNRNGISIIDGENISIDDCIFTNLSSAAQPGAIDIEPNSQSFTVVKNINVRNSYFYNNNGSANIVINLQNEIANYGNFNFIGNYMYGMSGNCRPFYFKHAHAANITDDTVRHEITVRGNTCIGQTGTASSFITVYGMRGVKFEGNTFKDMIVPAYVSGVTTTGSNCREITFFDNIFQNIVATSIIRIGNIDYLDIIKNKFIDCAAASSDSYIMSSVSSSSSSYIRLLDNEYLAPNTSYAKDIWAGSTHTFNAATNVFLRNRIDVTMKNDSTYMLPAFITDMPRKYGIFTSSTLPSAFPVGTSITVVASESAAPSTVKDGTYKVEKLNAEAGTEDLRGLITQWYYPKGTNEVWMRKGVTGSDTWGSWSALSLSTHTHTASDVGALPISGGTLTGVLNHNKATDIAVASTTDIGAANGNYIELTGTGTITSFGTGEVGQLRLVRFMSAGAIITHDFNYIVLPTSANITVLDGDSALFVNTASGKWKCLSYIRRDGNPLVVNPQYTKAFASFTLATADNKSGTYSRSGTTVTVTCTSHGLKVGNKVYLDFTSGAASDGAFVVQTVADTSTFTITHGSSGTTSGNVTLRFCQLNASGNVNSVSTDYAIGSTTVSVYINFNTAFSGTSYGVLSSPVTTGWSPSTKTTMYAQIYPLDAMSAINWQETISFLE